MTKRFATHLMGIAALLLLATTIASGQRKIPTAEQMLSVNGAQGTEFWITIPPNEILPYQVSALEVYIASAFDTEVEIWDAAGGAAYRRNVIAGEIRTLKDVNGETNWTWEVRDYEVVVNKAIRITADKPISVYVLNGKVFTSEGYLAIPTSVWGTEYIATAYYDYNEIRPWAGGFIIVAKKNGTVVDITLRGEGDPTSRTQGGRKLGDRWSVSMQEGDVYCVMGDGTTRGYFDISGSLIRSNEPIGLFSFHQRTTVPNSLPTASRDHLVEMTPPVQTWGKKYVSVEYNRVGTNNGGKGDLFRVFASENNTEWSMKYYNKTSKALLGQSGGILARAGDVATITQATAPTELTNGYSVWESNNPIFVMQYATSSNFDGDQLHDPFMINVVPEEQFIPNTIFQTPTDPKFLTHYLNLIVHADIADPDYIENLKSLEIDDIPLWNHPKSVAPTLLFNHMGDNLHWVTIIFGTEAKAHRITGNGKVKFGGYIYGFGRWDSYGWPAASGFKPTGVLDTMPPQLVADTLCGDFTYTATEIRNIPDPPRNPPGDSDQVETGVSQIIFVPDAPNVNYRINLITDQDMPFRRDPFYTKFDFMLEVIDKSKDAYAEFMVWDYADNVTYDTVWYFADDLTFTPNPLNFKEIRLGTKKQLDVTVTNDSDGEVTLTESTIQTGTYYAIVAGQLPPEKTLQPTESHTFTIEYSGDRETIEVETDWDLDTLIVTSDCGEFKIGIDGVASLPCIVVENFEAGTIGIGEEKCKNGGLRIRNPGSDTLVITAINGYQGSNFTLSNPSDPALPIVILPKKDVFLKAVCYQRTDVGVDSIDVVFTSNATGAPTLMECGTIDSISTWTGRTNTPGPRIAGHNWLKRRLNTLHPEFGEVRVWNTGNRQITLTDVTFADGTKYFPAGTGEADYVFKLGRILDNGTPVTDVGLLDGKEVFVEAWFRPAIEIVYTAPIVPVWADGSVDPVSDVLEGEGMIPQQATVGGFLTCAATPEGQTVTSDLVITNASGSEDLTISNLRFAAGTDPSWAWATPPADPLTVAQGASVNIPVNFTRPIGNNLGFNLTVEFDHDAVRGNGADATITPISETEAFGVGSCSGPDILVTNINYGRQLANCDEPQLDFTISNTGGGNVPLEIRNLVPVGPNAGAYTIVNIIGPGGVTAAVPFTIPAGETATVTVRFTPVLPDAAPWNDHNYDAQIHVLNYVEGATDELRPDTYVNVSGVGFVIPISFELSNTTNGGVINPGDDNGNASQITFSVSAVSGSWQRAGLMDYIADVTYKSEALAIDPNRVNVNNNWELASPVEITEIDGETNRARFVLTSGTGGTAMVGDGVVFTFGATLLLGSDFTSEQTLDVDLLRACLIPSTVGTSTEITNCALTKRVISISGTQFSFQPVSPNPVINGQGTVNFGVGIDAPTTIDVINLQGEVVAKLVDQQLSSGEYTLQFPTGNLGNGVYFLRMQSADYTKTQQVIVGD